MNRVTWLIMTRFVEYSSNAATENSPCRETYTRTFGDRPRHFEPWSSREYDTRVGAPSPSYQTTTTGGRMSSQQF
ncbi:hypothetical protein TNCV_3111171 [Trichonephila clavipes]|nr:hypothetical protein TNCV_3111171 [Trichonephila clavipes]